MENDQLQPGLDTWAIVELFGHQKVAGRLTTQTLGSACLLRLDVPEFTVEVKRRRYDYSNPAPTHIVEDVTTEYRQIRGLLSERETLRLGMRRLEERGRALRLSEERFNFAVRGSSDGIWDWDVVTNDVYYSLRFKELLAYEDREFENVLGAKTILARIRLQRSGVSLEGDLDLTLEHLLEQSSGENSAKDSLLEILDALGPEDPRYVSYRRKLASRLY